MGWQEFTLGLVKVLAWPTTVVFGALYLRSLLEALVNRVASDLNAGRKMKLNFPGGFSLELSDSSAETTGVWIPDTVKGGETIDLSDLKLRAGLGEGEVSGASAETTGVWLPEAE